MTAFASQALAAPGRQRAKGNALINFYIVANNGGFTDNNAGAVVDEEVLTHGGAGVNVNAGDAVGVLCHNPGEHRHIQGVQHVGQPVYGNGKQTGIGKNNLCHTGGCRVAVIGSLQVRLHHRPHGGNLPEEL